VNHSQAPLFFLVTEIEDLDFDALCIRHARRRQAFAPDEDATVTAFLHVLPIQLDDEVFILTLCGHEPGGYAGGDDHAVTHTEGIRRYIDGTPASEVSSIEHGNKTILICRPNGGGEGGGKKGGGEEE
jgi:hypothetical protein